MGFDPFLKVARMAHRPFCAVEFRRCKLESCQAVFATFPRLRRKYCSDLCAATSYAARNSNRYTVAGALMQLQRSRVNKRTRPEPEDPQVERRSVPRNPIVNRHTPGSIAYLILYGGGGAFSFNTHPGGEKVTCGGAVRGGQIGGPTL